MVVVQHPAQSLPSPDRSTMRRQTSLGSIWHPQSLASLRFAVLNAGEPIFSGRSGFWTLRHPTIESLKSGRDVILEKALAMAADPSGSNHNN